MSPARDQDYLCDGVAEEIINALTHVRGLRVAARSASFQFRGPGVDVRAAGRQLGVAALLEGSIRKADDRLRITVQLVEVADGYHRWSQRFDRTLDDVFAIQDEIAEAVVASLRAGDLSQRRGRRCDARRRRPRRTSITCGGAIPSPHEPPDLGRSRAMFARAIELEPATGRRGPAWRRYTPRCTSGSAPETKTSKRPSVRADEHWSWRPRSRRLTRHEALPSRCHDVMTRRSGNSSRRSAINPSSFDAYYYFARSSFARGDRKRAADLFRAAAEVRQEDFQSPTFSLRGRYGCWARPKRLAPRVKKVSREPSESWP